MNILWAVINILIGILLVIKYFSFENNIRSLNEQIQYICVRNTQMEVKTDTKNLQLKKLVKNINQFILKYRETESVLKKQNRLFRETITNLAHDIRTPLTISSGYLQLLEKEKLTNEQFKYISIAKERIYYLKNLLEQLFEFVLIEANELKLDFRCINIFNIFRDMLAVYYDKFENNGGIVSIAIPDEACWIWADENAIKRTLVNIFNNSLIHGDGEFSFEACCTEKMCMIRISNNSAEIAKEELVSIFERTFTADKSRSDKKSGLGLAIAKKIIDLHEGTIEASYINGRFFITINLPFRKI